MMMASLVALEGNNLVVEFPDEPRTGADMEWNFVSGDWRSFYRIYIQAKRLYGTGKSWKRYSYRELLHESGGRLQAVTLADTARNAGPGCYPLYAFYNPKHVCEKAARAGEDQVAGVSLVDGYVICSYT